MEKYGVIIERGAADWQIFQRDQQGTAQIELEGYYVSAHVLPQFPVTVVTDDEEPDSIQIRIVRECDGSTVKDWTEAERMEQNRWKAVIADVPAGGLYRIESCLKYAEWDCRKCTRGDMIHHIGVGDIFLIAGQSNAAGRSKAVVMDEPSMAVHVLRSDGCWDMASHPLGETTDMLFADNFENHNPGHSPWLHFAKILQREMGYPIGLIPAASGGTPIKWWLDREAGNLTDCAVKLVNKAASKIKAVLWSQGEADTGESAEAYEENLIGLIGLMRSCLSAPSLPFIMVQTNRCLSDAGAKQDRGYGMVRQAQLSAMKLLENVWTVPSADLPVWDVMHNSSAADMVIGERCAGCALSVIYGKERKWRGPMLDRAVGKGASLYLYFQEVSGWLELYDVQAPILPLEVEDENGFITVISYRAEMSQGGLHGSCRLELQLERMMGKHAKVHGAWRAFPGRVIPSDGQGMPMYSFYNVEIEEEEDCDQM